MDDGNWLNTYMQPAALVVFKEEIDSNWRDIDIGLFGSERTFVDA